VLTPVAGVAAHGLRVEQVIAAEPLDDRAWAHFLARVSAQRLEGLAAQAVADGAVAVTEAQATELAERETRAAGWALLLERALVETAATLRGAEVPVRVLKGSAVARLDYPDPALRLFGDVDVLMPSDHVERGIAALVEAGCTRPVAELAPGFDRRFGKGATLRRPDGVEVDVHRILVSGSFGLRFDGDRLFGTEEEFEVGGQVLPALHRPQRFLHACYHAALGNPVPRLVPVRDVAQMAAHSAFDWAAALDEARRWRGEAVVARALQLCTEVLGVELDDTVVSWAAAFEPSGRDRRAIAACLRQDGRFARQAIGALPDVPGVRGKVAYARALAFPRTDHLAGRDRGRAAHLLEAVRRLGQRDAT
jgi:hypothetical protein